MHTILTTQIKRSRRGRVQVGSGRGIFAGYRLWALRNMGCALLLFAITVPRFVPARHPPPENRGTDLQLAQRPRQIMGESRCHHVGALKLFGVARGHASHAGAPLPPPLSSKNVTTNGGVKSQNTTFCLTSTTNHVCIAHLFQTSWEGHHPSSCCKMTSNLRTRRSA